MAKSSVEAYGASGETKVLLIEPEKLKLVTDPKHPLYDKRVDLPVDERLVLSIMEQGIIEPIRIRKNPETGDVEVVFGRQRVKAALEANKRLKKEKAELVLVPCQAPRGSDAAVLFGVSVAENEIRQDDTPLGRAEKARRLIELGRSEEQVARVLGVTTTTVKSMLTLLDATGVVRQAVEKGSVSTSNGYQLAKLEPDEQRKRLEKILKEAPRVTRKSGKTRAAKGTGKKAARIAAGPGKEATIRSAKEITAMSRVLAGTSGEKAKIAVAALDWVMGDEGSLESVLGKDD